MAKFLTINVYTDESRKETKELILNLDVIAYIDIESMYIKLLTVSSTKPRLSSLILVNSNIFFLPEDQMRLLLTHLESANLDS